METVRKIQNNKYTIIFKNKDIYQGEAIKTSKSNKLVPHGYGKYYSKKVNYSGYWDNGLKHGKGILVTKNDFTTIYNGEFKENNRHGVCVEKKYNNGRILVFEGTYFNDLKHGSAIEYTENDLNPELVKKFDIKYNMGFTNSLKEFNFTKNNFTIQGFTHNNNKIGPVIINKTIRNSNYIYKGDYNNQISGQGILEIELTKHLKTIFTGTFKPLVESDNHKSFSAYSFDGIFESFNYLVNDTQDLKYSILPEFYNLIKSNFIKSYKLIINGKFIIKFKPYSLEPDITVTSTFSFKSYNLKNKTVDKLILSGKRYLINELNSEKQIDDIIKSIKDLNLKDDNKSNKSKLCYQCNSSNDDSSIDSDSSIESDSSSDSDYNWSSDSDEEINYPTLITEVKKKINVQRTTTGDIELLNNYILEKIKKLAEEKNDEILKKLENFDIIKFITKFNNTLKVKLEINASFHDEICEMTCFDKYPDLYFGKKYYIDNDKKKLINIGIFTDTFNLYRNSRQDSILFRLAFRDNKINYCSALIKNEKYFLIAFLKDNNDTHYLEYKGTSINFEKFGKGIEYYNNGNIKYDGEFKWNIPHGNGSLYDISGGIIFTGRFSEGAPALD